MGRRRQRTTKLPNLLAHLAGNNVRAGRSFYGGAMRGSRIIMARNFGVPRNLNSFRGSLWPLLAVTFIIVGIIEVATHLGRWVN